MKYNIPRTSRLYFYTVLYTFRAQKVLYLLLPYLLLGIVGAWIYRAEVPELAFVWFGPLFLLAIIIVLGERANNKLFADASGKINLTYDITQDVITVSVQGKANLVFEKAGLKKSRVYKKGVYIKHKRASLVVHLPDEKREQILRSLKEYKWIA
jgi:hypothetical protein